MKKSDLKIIVSSVLVVVVAMVVAFVEAFLLVKYNGVSFDSAMLVSLYTGFLAVIMIFAFSVGCGDWFYKIIK